MALPLPSPAPTSEPTPGAWRLSTIALVAANVVPLIGVLGFHWTVFPILLLYWCENVVIGVYNVLRMICVAADQPVIWVGKAFLIPFFIVHYGGFAFVHGLFVLTMFSGGGNPSFTPGGMFAAVRSAHVGYGIVALVLSHGISFGHNFLGGGEFRRTGLNDLMTRPYARVMVLHFTILAGGFLVMSLHSALPALVVLILVKTGIDLSAHRAERKKLGRAPARDPLLVLSALLGQRGGEVGSGQLPPKAL